MPSRRATRNATSRTRRWATSPAPRRRWRGTAWCFRSLARPASWDDETGKRFLYGLDARYRGYFGTEELKTFFEVGLWATLQSRLAAGPQAGLGLAYDPNRDWGAFLSLHFGTAFGDARISGLGASLGVQFRFE